MVLIYDFEEVLDDDDDKFPSPCGDYGSYHDQVQEVLFLHTQRFRPLAGIMVLIFKNLNGLTISYGLVSVPLRGLWFLSIILSAFWSSSRICFRPLAGIMVLITMHNHSHLY